LTGEKHNFQNDRLHKKKREKKPVSESKKTLTAPKIGRGRSCRARKEITAGFQTLKAVWTWGVGEKRGRGKAEKPEWAKVPPPVEGIKSHTNRKGGP